MCNKDLQQKVATGTQDTVRLGGVTTALKLDENRPAAKSLTTRMQLSLYCSAPSRRLGLLFPPEALWCPPYES
jgi:hypothetical protein